MALKTNLLVFPDVAKGDIATFDLKYCFQMPVVQIGFVLEL